MDKKHFISLTLIFLFLISISSDLAVAQEDDRSYTIPYANIDLYVHENGNLHVKERIHYSFSGTYNGVYRDIPIKSGERIENIKISAQGAYSSYEITRTGDTQSLKIFLYSNPQKTIPITDRDVDVFIEYDFINVIKIYNDVAELQYKLWGEEWDVDVGQVNGNIFLKSNNGVKYWLNPPYFAKSSTWNGGNLKIESERISPGSFFEVRMAIPKDQFVTNPPFAQIINIDGLPEMERIQQEYQSSLAFWEFLYSLLAVLMLLALFLPLLIYYKFGREPKIDYHAEYERDLPTNDPPAVVNAISGAGFSKQVGEPDMDGFKATLMELIDDGYVILERIPSAKGKDKDVILKVNENKDQSNLERFQKDIIDFLYKFEEDGEVSLKELKKELKEPSVAESFRNMFNIWKYDVKKAYLDDKTLEKIFIKKGDTYLKIFGAVGIATAVIIFIFTLFDDLPASIYALVASIPLGIVALLSLLMPQKIGGRWTTYGQEYDAKWQNFKKYIKDFSLIKEHPPESVIIWNKYLVYATALGIADEVRKSMEIAVPKEDLERSDIYLFHYYGGYVLLSSSMNTGMTTTSGSGGAGGVGGVGGGSGGGGGGAF